MDGEQKQLPSIKKTAKLTAVATVAIGAIVLQVVTFRVVGDIVTSFGLFGLGYMAGRYLK